MNLHNQLTQLRRLDDLICRKATGTLYELAAKFDVSISTIMRYINELKDVFQAPIAYDRVRSTYYYAEPFELILNIEVSVNGQRKKII